MIDWLGQHVVAILGGLLSLLLIVLASRWLIIRFSQRSSRIRPRRTLSRIDPDETVFSTVSVLS
jgi:flagellar biogenesis protein FliO